MSGVTNPTTIERHFDDLLFDFRKTALTRVVQDEVTTLAVWAETFITRFSFLRE
jgi:hypothetical protein